MGVIPFREEKSVIFQQRQRIGCQLIQFGVIEAKPRLHGSWRELLAEEIGHIVGAEGVSGMRFHQGLSDCLGAVQPDQLQQTFTCRDSDRSLSAIPRRYSSTVRRGQ